MSQDFTTRLQLELRAAAERQERRSALGRLRMQLPRPSVLAIAAAAAAVLLALVLAGGLGWHREETITAPRVTKTLPLADNLGSIASGFGAVWVSDPATPQVLRLDPATHKVTARVPAMDNPILNTGAGAVWVVGFIDDVVKPETLLKIDPDTARVVARTRLRVGGQPFVAGDVQIVGDEVWVMGRDGVLRIDPATGRIAQHFAFAQREGDPFPQAAWVTPDGIVALRREGRIERYDAHTGRLDGLLPVRLADARHPRALGRRAGARHRPRADRAGRAAARGHRVGPPAARHGGLADGRRAEAVDVGERVRRRLDVRAGPAHGRDPVADAAAGVRGRRDHEGRRRAVDQLPERQADDRGDAGEGRLAPTYCAKPASGRARR